MPPASTPTSAAAAACWSPARRRRPLPIGARRCGTANDAGLLADPRPHAAPVADGHQPAVRRRRLRRARAGRRAGADADSDGDVRPAGEGVERQDRDDGARPGRRGARAGRAAYLPWDVGGLYYRHSSPAHAALLADVIDQLLPSGRQLRTERASAGRDDADGAAGARRTLVHLVNGTATRTRPTSRRSSCATSASNCPAS